MKNKVVVLTGANSGIGKHCAQILSKNYNVYGTTYGEDEKENKSLSYMLIPCDITKNDSVENFFKKILSKENRIDVLINCAGYGFGGGVEDTTIDEAKHQFEVNFFGMHRVVKQTLPIMRKQKNGMIITVSSLASEVVIPFQSFYSTSKMALTGLSLALRMELADFGIKVTSVHPGDVKSKFTTNRMIARKCKKNTPYFRQTMNSINTMKKDENEGLDPRFVAKFICNLVEKNKLKPKYFIEPKYRLLMFVKRFFSDSLIEKILKKMYLL